MGLVLVSGPTVEPVSLDETKASVNAFAVDDNGEIDQLISAARQRIERVTGRQLVTATWDLVLGGFPCENVIVLPRPPLISVVSVSYVDTAGATQVWGASNYQVDIPVGPTASQGRIQPAYGISWPAARTDTLNAVTVRFTAGYGATGDSVPADLRLAAKLFVRGWFGGDVEDGRRAEQMLTPYKVYC